MEEGVIDAIHRMVHQLAANNAQVPGYSGWADKFVREESIRNYKKFHEKLREFDLALFTSRDLLRLGFQKLHEESSLHLIPLHLFGGIKDGVALTCIDGSTAIVGKDPIDRDTRRGCIAWGFIPVDLR